MNQLSCLLLTIADMKHVLTSPNKNSNVENQSKELDTLKQTLKSKEHEMQRIVDEALKQAQEERELARIERKAAEADRLAAKADRQVAQRELIASARKNSGSYSVNDIMEALHNEVDNLDTANRLIEDAEVKAVSSVQSHSQKLDETDAEKT